MICKHGLDARYCSLCYNSKKENKMKRGTIKKFREYLNNKHKNTLKWKHNRYHQLKRSYGDYLYYQDKVRFELELKETLKGNIPEYNDFLNQIKEG